MAFLLTLSLCTPFAFAQTHTGAGASAPAPGASAGSTAPGAGASGAAAGSVAPGSGAAAASSVPAGACTANGLSEAERNRLLNLAKSGRSFGTVASGDTEDPYRDRLQNNVAVIPDSEGEYALQEEFPHQEFYPDEAAFAMNLVGKGFAFGIVLDDTLRVGRCVGDGDNPLCWVRGDGLRKHTDGSGILEDVATASASLFSDPLLTADAEFDQAALDLATAEAALESGQDVNEVSVSMRLLKWKEGEPLPNRIETQWFEAKMGTTCDNATCYITTYSLFDKYFNSVFSADLVVSNFGPTVIGQVNYYARRAASRTGFSGGPLKNIWPFREPFHSFASRAVKKDVPLEVLPNAGKNYDFRERKFKEVGDAFGGLVQGGAFISDGKYSKWSSDFWESVPKRFTTYETRRAAVDQATEVFRFSRVAAAQADNFKKLYDAGQITKNEYGRRLAAIFQDYDNAFHFDFGPVFVGEERHNLSKVFVRQNTSGEITRLNTSNLPNKLMGEYGKQGRFGGVFEAGPNGGLQLYKPSPTGAPVATGVTLDSFEASVVAGDYSDFFVRLDTGEYVPAQAELLDYIRPRAPPSLTLYRADLVPDREITPDDFSDLVVEWLPSRVQATERNMGKLYEEMREKGWASRRYYSIMDKLLMEENEVFKNYFQNPIAAAKWTALPFGYWYAKKGLNQDNFSAYQLPDSWSELTFSHGDQEVYDDAYIDFFANAGSDTGDIFVQALNWLPWKSLALDSVAEHTPFERAWNSFTGEENRKEVEELAFFSYGPRTCSSCTIAVQSPDLDAFDISFKSGEQLQGFAFEHTQTEEAKELGQALISFGHHLDIEGRVYSEDLTQIDLVNARREGDTCAQNTIKLGLVEIPASSPGWTAFGLAVGESVGYAFFGLGGVFGSAVQQLAIAPQLANCVDDRGGYYAHLFVPGDFTKPQDARAVDATNDTIGNIIEDSRDTLKDALSGSSVNLGILSIPIDDEDEGAEGGKGVFQNAFDRLDNGLDEMLQSIRQKDVAQSSVSMEAGAQGSLEGKKLFYLWFAPEDLKKAAYSEKGKTTLESGEGEDKTVLDVDNESGTAKITDALGTRDVVTSPDHVRLANPNLAAGGYEFPVRLTNYRPNGSADPVMRMLETGEVFVSDPGFLDCVRAAVLAQTGVPLTGNELSNAFGLAESMSTTSGTLLPTGDAISAELSTRLVFERPAAATVSGASQVSVSGSNAASDVLAGRLVSVVFKNGAIYYKEATGEWIIWLKHHERSVLRDREVAGLRGTLTSDPNPETGCDEPAIDLSVLPIDAGAGSDIDARAKNLNDSLGLNGPFQVFEGDKHVFILYSDPAPACTPHLKIVDKETGEVYDGVIEDIVQTPDGVRITTEDGKTHDIGFSAENGKPTITYNGVPETLLRAQGRNGSFYYDPQKGLWYSENGQFVPLDDNFRQGLQVSADENGRVTGTAGTNIFVGGEKDDGADWLNVPGVPQAPLLFVVFIVAAMGAVLFARYRRESEAVPARSRRKKKR